MPKHSFSHNGITVGFEGALDRAHIRSTTNRGSLGGKFVSQKHSIQHEAQPKETNGIRTIALLVSQACNLRCTYCYAGEGDYGKLGLMSYDTAISAVKWLVMHSGDEQKLSIIFFGGEPLLAFELIMSVIEYTEEMSPFWGKTFDFSITTNAIGLTDCVVNYLAEKNVNVMVSVDGPKAVHDSQRPTADGLGSYDEVVEGAKRLLKRMPMSPARATLTGAATADAVRAELYQLGFKRTGMSIASGVFCETSSTHSLNEQISAIKKLLDSDAEKLLALVKARNRAELRTLDTPLANYLLEALKGKSQQYPCGAGRKLVACSATGSLYVCHRFVENDQFMIGSVHDPSNVKSIENLLKAPLDESSKCKACFAKQLCGGACYHDSLTSSGSIYSPSTYVCRIMQRITELVAYVICQCSAPELEDFKHSMHGESSECEYDYF